MIKKFKSFESSDTKDLLNKMRKLSGCTNQDDRSDIIDPLTNLASDLKLKSSESDVKSEVKPTDLKLKSVEYILFKMINWYISENNIKSVEEFNKKYKFSDKIISIFPFFIFAADSGKRDKILEIFNFRAGSIGIIDIDINDDMLDKSTLFDFYPSKTKIIDDKFNFEKELSIKEKDYFKDIEEYIPIFDASFKILYNKNRKFINLEENTLIFYSQRHNSWHCFYGPELLDQSKTFNIPKFILLDEKSIFSGKKETFSYL